VSAALAPATAKRYHVRRKGAIPRRDLEFKTPGVYEVHVRFSHRTTSKLRHARRVQLLLRTTLEGATNSVSSTTPLSLRR